MIKEETVEAPTTKLQDLEPDQMITDYARKLGDVEWFIKIGYWPHISPEDDAQAQALAHAYAMCVQEGDDVDQAIYRMSGVFEVRVQQYPRARVADALAAVVLNWMGAYRNSKGRLRPRNSNA
jgi:hypothetical protein